MEILILILFKLASCRVSSECKGLWRLFTWRLNKFLHFLNFIPESKSELDAICLNLKEKTSAESNRFRWKNIKNFPGDPESSGAEDQAGMEVLSSTAAEKVFLLNLLVLFFSFFGKKI